MINNIRNSLFLFIELFVESFYHIKVLRPNRFDQKQIMVLDQVPVRSLWVDRI